MKKLLLSLGAVIASTFCFTTQATDLYVIGANVDGQNWALKTNQMTDNGDGTYTWTGNELGSGFKINDGSWSGTYNIGAGSGNLEIGVPYQCNNAGTSGNINFSEATLVVQNPKVTLDLNSLMLTVTGQESEQGISLTLAGSFNEWAGKDSEYELAENNGIYSKTFNIPAAAEGNTEFQVVLNGVTWYGFENEEEANIDLSAQSTVTVSLSTGNENNFVLADWEGGDLNFSVNYEAKTLTVSLPDGNNPGDQPDDIITLYVIGADVDGEVWALETNQMDYNSTTGLYSWSGSNLASGFKINDGTWDNKEWDLGAPNGSSELELNVAFTVGNSIEEGSQDIKFASCASVSQPTVVFNPKDMTVTVTGTPVGEPEPEPEPDTDLPTVLYLIGDVTGWDPTQGLEMKMDAPGIFSIASVEMAGDASYFAFTSQLGSWDDVNSHRYSPSTKDFPFVLDSDNAIVANKDTSWKIDGGTYDFTVNLNTMVATAKTSGINGIYSEDKGVDVVYNLQGIRVDANKLSKGIYIINGKKVLINK